MKNILIIDDDPEICLLLSKYLQKKGFETIQFNAGKEAELWLKQNGCDLILCDFKLPDYNGLEMIEKIKILRPQVPIILITGYSDVRTAVEALKKGAFEYVTKPLYPDEILVSIQEALQHGTQPKAERTTQRKTQKTPKRTFIKGESPSSRAVQKHIELIAPTDMSVIITGETGTGKEYAARAIHEQSKRAGQPFVALDCGAIPKELAGSELFGHVKGAFTGALKDKKGCFEIANGGTLFLDEIGNLTYENQVKLLRVLQERSVKPIGSNQQKEVDVRILVATNEDLKKAVRKGDFREDIYHRLNEFKIELSPLRERLDDITIFTEHFIQKANLELEKEVKALSNGAWEKLKTHSWPGNLRELKNVIKRAVLLAEAETIEVAHLPQDLSFSTDQEDETIQLLIEQDRVYSLKKVTEVAEKQAIQNALKFTNNNRTKTAELLQVDRKTLYNKLKAYNL